MWVKKLRELRLVPTSLGALSSFAGWLPAFTVWFRCKISEQVWSPDNNAHMCHHSPCGHLCLRSAFYGGCVRDAFGRAGWLLSVDQACTQSASIVWSRCWRLLTNNRVITMQTLDPLPDRYRSIKSSITDSNPLVIDTEANPQDILEAALQRIRASSQLLETLHCLCFKHGDVQDIPHITHALYLLTQDGCDLLTVAQQRIMGWKAPV